MGEHRRQKKPFSRVSEAMDVLPAQKLLIRYLVRLSQQTNLLEIQRGDLVFAQDGVEAGIVAAILVDCHRQEATHFLLGLIPPTAVYHLVPISMINRIDEKTVWLRITSEAVKILPKYQPGC